MEPSAKTVYTEQLLLNFHWFSLKRKIVFWIIMTLYNIFMIGSSLLILKYDGFLSTSIKLCLGMTVALDIFILVIYFILPFFTIKKSKNIGTGIVYTFHEDEFNINAVGIHASENSTLKYTALKKAIKTDDAIYLYINKINAFIVAIDDLNYEELYFIKNALTDSLGANKVKWKI